MIFKRVLGLIFLVGLITTACHTNVTKAGKPSGQVSAQKTQNTSGPLALTFSKPSYAGSDTIKISLFNKSDSDIAIALRCGHYLEMSYQKSENGHWSQNKELSYMMLKCPTHSHTIKPHEKYECSIPSALFKSMGSFRLLVSFNVASDNTDQTTTSVPFEIR